MNYYYEQLERRIDRALQQNKSTFREIVRECRGAYPIDILQILKSKNALQTEKQEVFFENVQGNGGTELITEGIEHNPVLCSWYFTIDTCRRIVSMRSWKNKKLLFLGMPRLFEYFIQYADGESYTLVELDDYVINMLEEKYGSGRYRMIHADIDSPDFCLGEQYDCIFLDPPWYMEYYDRWLGRAGGLLEEREGVLLFPLFQELTRPDAGHQRDILLEKIEENAGDHLLLLDYVEYEIPTFERNELENCGIVMERPWKKADLVIAKGLLKYEPQMVEEVSEREHWEEVELFRIRVFLRLNLEEEEGCAPVKIRYLTENGPYLRNPSKRNEELQKADMLTSRGQGYMVQSAGNLLKILKELKEKMENGADIHRVLNAAWMDEKSRKILEELFGGKTC